MKTFIWFIAIFLCASIFRLTNMDLIEFKLDEARDVYEMVKFYNEPYLIQRGTIQSTGVYNPPLWYYFLALISLPSRDPQYLSFVIALLNCLAVVGFYLGVRKFYGQFAGVAAAGFLAFSPWAILFSRKIWAPDLLMVLLVPLFYFLHVIYQQKWAWFWVVLLLSLLAQLHASGLFLAFASIIVITIITVIRKIKFNFKFALLGFILSLIPLIPYLIYQFQTGCEDCQNFFNYQSEVKAFDINVFLRPFQLIGGSSFSLILGDDYQSFLDQSPFIKVFNLLFLAEFILGILGILFLCSPRPSSKWWLLATLGAVPLLYLITQTPAHPHYSIILLPIMVLIYTLGLAFLRKVSKNLWIPTFVGMTVVAINIIFNFSFYQFIAQKQNIQGDYGPIFKLTKQKLFIQPVPPTN